MPVENAAAYIPEGRSFAVVVEAPPQRQQSAPKLQVRAKKSGAQNQTKGKQAVKFDDEASEMSADSSKRRKTLDGSSPRQSIITPSSTSPPPRIRKLVKSAPEDPISSSSAPSRSPSTAPPTPHKTLLVRAPSATAHLSGVRSPAKNPLSASSSSSSSSTFSQTATATGSSTAHLSAATSSAAASTAKRGSYEDERYYQFLRATIKRRILTVNNSGPGALTSSDHDVLRRTLEALAFSVPLFQHPEWIKSNKLLQIVRLLRSPHDYGDDIAEAAKTLAARWEAGDYSTGPIFPRDDIEDVSSEDGSESEDEGGYSASNDPDRQAVVGSGRVQIPAYTSHYIADLMRDIKRELNKRGHIVYRIHPGRRPKPADVWGHNGLEVGQWWPYQICALRDGAHGSRMGGIYGKSDTGAFSVVVAGGDDYHDKDLGDTIYYSGSHGDPPRPGDTGPQLTAATKQLTLSYSRGRPVRVLRKGPGKGAWAPKGGLRYDGLYRVTNRVIERGRDGERDWYKFTLVRMEGQKPLCDLEISRRDYSAWVELTGMHSRTR